MKTFRRDKLRKLIEAGRVVTVGTYSFDDMSGERRTSHEMPVGHVSRIRRLARLQAGNGLSAAP
jgi:hypothetical protein